MRPEDILLHPANFASGQDNSSPKLLADAMSWLQRHELLNDGSAASGSGVLLFSRAEAVADLLSLGKLRTVVAADRLDELYRC